MELNKKVWAIAGGKGGAGNSVLAAGMAAHLAELGFRAVLADLDFQSPNLHTMLGMERPEAGLSDFIERRKDSLDECAVQTGISNLRLLAGVMEPEKGSYLRYQQKRRIMRELPQMDADVVVLDLPAGAGLSQVELFSGAHAGALLVTPEPTCMENAFRLLKMIYFHQVAKIPGFKELLRHMPPGPVHSTDSPVKFLKELETLDHGWSKKIRKSMECFQPALVINQARSDKDRELGHMTRLVIKRHFGIVAPFLGAVDYDECVWEAVRARRPVVVAYPYSRPSRAIRQITENLVSLSRRPL